jgi:RNA 3'-terminal phosphate cyclase-like protein
MLDYEISLLRLLEKVTNGTIIEISVTGTLLFELKGILRRAQGNCSCL